VCRLSRIGRLFMKGTINFDYKPSR